MRFRCKKMDFISEIDQLFAQWDKSHMISASQAQEIEKYRNINNLRDNIQKQEAALPISDEA